ncbi:hypothetical protein PANO66_03625 [Planktothrix agardhii]|uniref:Uncharacterized protein n=1 Tax=Planktothrix agardhii TaxID=1160 RepID=A0AAD1Q554_PLAAG|nr:hypothetical protein PANO66_03625 [Planktothrix agardhii]
MVDLEQSEEELEQEVQAHIPQIGVKFSTNSKK